jgi:hypothetical protein
MPDVPTEEELRTLEPVQLVARLRGAVREYIMGLNERVSRMTESKKIEQWGEISRMYEQEIVRRLTENQPVEKPIFSVSMLQLPLDINHETVSGIQTRISFCFNDFASGGLRPTDVEWYFSFSRKEWEGEETIIFKITVHPHPRLAKVLISTVLESEIESAIRRYFPEWERISVMVVPSI